MNTSEIVATVAVGTALSLVAALATAPAGADATADQTASPMTDHNPLSDYEGYCTWGAQEQIHEHTGYYMKALTGSAENWANQAQAAGLTVVGEAQPHSIAVFSSSLVGGVGHVASGRRRQRTADHHHRNEHGPRGHRRERIPHRRLPRIRTRVVDVPGMIYILIP